MLGSMRGWRESKSVSGAAMHESLARIRCQRLSESVQLNSGKGEGVRPTGNEFVRKECTELASALAQCVIVGFLVVLLCLKAEGPGGMFSCNCCSGTTREEGMGRHS